MRCYNQPHRFYCGVDLHARSLYAHVLDAKGKTVLDRDLPASPTAFLDAVQPLRDGLVVGAECMTSAWREATRRGSRGVGAVLTAGTGREGSTVTPNI